MQIWWCMDARAQTIIIGSHKLCSLWRKKHCITGTGYHALCMQLRALASAIYLACRGQEVRNDHVLWQKCFIITFYPHRLYIVNFDGEFRGWSLGILEQKRYDCDQRSTFELEIPFSFNTATLACGDTPTLDSYCARYTQKSRGIAPLGP